MIKLLQLFNTSLVCLLLVCQAALAEETDSIDSSEPLIKPLVETSWLANNLDNVFILDVRDSKKSFISKPVFNVDKKTGKKTLLRVGGHIPTAHYIEYKPLRGEQIIDGTTIKYMLPNKNVFESQIQAAGAGNEKHIVIVTNAANDFDITMASRVYWQLKYFGQKEVSILNGGTAQWLMDGREVSSTFMKPPKGNWKAKAEQKELLASSKDVANAINNTDTQIIDARIFSQYLGTSKSSKVLEKGHIETAKIYPVELMVTRRMPVKFLSIDELHQVTHALGIKPDQSSITYCNSGHLASGGWFVMHALLGNQHAKLYDGSMHQWTTEKRPVVRMKIE
jgi:thiosulfate/3-mercaptopyruvate sulfurtransferase